MLKIRLNDNNIKENYVEIFPSYDDLVADNDLTTITGYLEDLVNIHEDSPIYITTTNNSNYTKLNTTVEHVFRTGSFIKNETFNIETVSDNIILNDMFDSKDVELYVYDLVEDEERGLIYKKNASKKTIFKEDEVLEVTKRFVKMPNNKIYYENYLLNHEKISGDSEYEEIVKTYNAYKDYYTVSKINNDGTTVQIYPTTKIHNNLQPYIDLDFYGYYLGLSTSSETTNYYIKDGTIITVPITYYAENDEVIYSGVPYSLSENYEIDENGIKSLKLYDFDDNLIADLGDYFEDNTSQKLIKFTSYVPDSMEISFEKIGQVSKFYYIIYNGNKWDFEFKDGVWQVKIIDSNNVSHIYKYEVDSIDYNIENLLDIYPSFIEVEGISCPILTEYRNVVEGDYISIYTSENYTIDDYSIPIEVNISAELTDYKKIYQGVNGYYYILYNNERIYLADNKEHTKENYIFTISKYIQLENGSETCEQYNDNIIEEFEVEIVGEYSSGASSFDVTYTDEYENVTYWKVIRNYDENNRDRAFKIGSVVDYSLASSDYVSANTVDISESIVSDTYKFNVYRYVTIDGVKYKADISNKSYEQTQGEYNIKIYSKEEKYYLDVFSYENNLMICKPKLNIDYYLLNKEISNNDDVNNILDILKRPYKEIVNEIATNDYNFIFFKNLYFGESNKPTVNQPSLNIMNNGFASFYKNVNYFSFQLPLKQSNELNIYQEDLVNSSFYEVEKEKAINSIIDMEKDIYYPVIQKKSDGSFEDVHKIKFNFHLRTRNMDDWTVNDLTYSDYSNVESENEKNDNWVIFDEYNNKEGLSSEALNASDLLYFFDFTENDVYYQKDRLRKTFLRLLFYDSADENNQNLLHTSTVFFDSSDAYKKYINNISSKEYQLYYMLSSDTCTYCTVDTEPIIDWGGKLINEDSDINYNMDRMDSSFSIVNRGITTESSEGFYLYMFKDYGLKLRPSTVYMKVELNHAGKGKILHFFMPTLSNNETLTNMIDDVDSKEISTLNTNQVEELKEGLPLNKVQKSQYIRFEVKYDESTHRYVYYIPNTYPTNGNYWENNNTMVFNLWELKFKNEI